jgi:hypothetical protein
VTVRFHDGSLVRRYRACADHLEAVKRHHQVRGYRVDDSKPLPPKEFPAPTPARVRDALRDGPMSTTHLSARLGVFKSEDVRLVREMARLAGAVPVRQGRAQLWTLP